MNQKNYFIMKEEQNNKNININNDRILSKEKKSFKNNSFTESEIKSEEYPPINKDSFILGLSLVFIYFSLIIYSLLYMLTPEKNANLIFEGDTNSPSFNNSLYNTNNQFYKLDSIRIRENLTLFGISKDFRNENNGTKQNLSIELNYSKKPKIINKILIINNYKSKEIDIGIKIYNNYKINDFPFWLALYNNEDIFNITSDMLNKISFVF